MRDPDNTSVETLIRAAEIGAEAGLNFVYAGNIPGRVGRGEGTYCPHCQQLLIARTGYWIDAYHLTPEGRCPNCGMTIPGIWWPSEEARRQGASPFAHRIARVS